MTAVITRGLKADKVIRRARLLRPSCARPRNDESTIFEILKEGIQILEQRGFEDARISCEELLSHTLKKPRFTIYVDGKDPIAQGKRTEFLKLVKKRANHEPLQYLIGNVSFRNIEIQIQKGVLIPRPETEILVETVLKKIAARKILNPKILDVGTGSGCIAISLAQEYSDAQIWATEVSNRALKLAKSNAKANQVSSRIKFLKVNYWPENKPKFDCIVSNPPYLNAEDFKELQPELEYEPKRALFGGMDGLNFYRFMIRHAQQALKQNGMMAFEVGAKQATKVADLFNTNQFDSIEIVKDFAGIERIVSATLKD